MDWYIYVLRRLEAEWWPTFGPVYVRYPESKVHGANMGPTWILSAPDGPHEPCYLGTFPCISAMAKY